MCTHDSSYSEALAKEKEATEKKEKCKEAIDYYKGWKPQIKSCSEYLEGMISQTTAIANSCAEIILNGKPIDHGERHYPNGGAKEYANSLRNIKNNLDKLITSIDQQLTILEPAYANAIIEENNWKNIVAERAKPRADCPYCFSKSSTPKNASTYRVATSTGSGSRNKSSSTRRTTPSTGRSHNRAVAVPL